jgi:lipopolysaccharide transport system permease protein
MSTADMEMAEAKILRQSPVEDPPDDDLPLTVIERQRTWLCLDLRELWRYRELLLFLTWRDVKVRYKQTVLGALWALLQPLGLMLTFTIFLRPSGDGDQAVPYPLFAFSGLLAWMLFGNALSSAGNSIVANQQLVTKIYFPRFIIPMSAVGVGLVDFAVGCLLLGGMMAWYGVAPGWGLLLVPVLVLLLAAAAVGIGAMLAALTVAYRDFRHVVPFLVQFWMFATPSIYRPDGVGPMWRPWMPFNPAYGLILNFRWAVLGETPDGHALYALVVSGAMSLLFLVAGSLYFRRVERSFADVI